MFRTIRDMLVGALIAGSITAAFATANYGIAPRNDGDEALINQQWLYGLSGGGNFTYQYAITATAGGTQAACFILPAETYLSEIDTVATTGDSACLPYARAGESLLIRNAGANTVDIYAQSTTNGATGSTDTINGSSNSSAYTISSNHNAICFAAKSGVWSCVTGS